MPPVVLADLITSAGTVATVFGPYVLIALAFVFGPRLLKTGVRMIKGK